MTISRDELYEEVWAEPMLTVAARYDVSSSYLARVCERMNVPRPPRGYWAKLRAGQKPAQVELPEPRPGDELEWSQDGTRVRRAPLVPKPPKRSQRRKRVPQRALPTTHGLIVDAREHFDKAKKDHDPKRGFWEPRGEFLKPTKRLLVDIFVSPDLVDRALQVASDLFLVFEEQGHRVEFAPRGHHYRHPPLDERLDRSKERRNPRSWVPARPTVTYFGEVAIGLTLFELTDPAEYEYVRGKPVRIERSHKKMRRRPTDDLRGFGPSIHDFPTGRLGLRAFSPYQGTDWEKQWHENEAGDLVEMAPAIIRQIAAKASTVAKQAEEAERRAAEQLKRWQEEHQRWADEQEAKRVQRERVEAEQRARRHLKESRDQLLSIVSSWKQTEAIDAFFRAAAHDAEQLAGDDERQRVLERLDAARELLGPSTALEQFRAWKAPDERT